MTTGSVDSGGGSLFSLTRLRLTWRAVVLLGAAAVVLLGAARPPTYLSGPRVGLTWLRSRALHALASNISFAVFDSTLLGLALRGLRPFSGGASRPYLAELLFLLALAFQTRNRYQTASFSWTRDCFQTFRLKALARAAG